jgi:hypothetical protein
VANSMGDGPSCMAICASAGVVSTEETLRARRVRVGVMYRIRTGNFLVFRMLRMVLF